MTKEQIFILISIVVFLIVGLFVKRTKISSIREFTMNKGKLNWFSVAAGISMTFAGGAAILNMSSLGYTFKWYTLVDPISLLIGIVIVLISYKFYYNDNGITISDLLSQNNNNLSILIGIITSFVFILIVSAQFVALSKLVSPYFPAINQLIITFILATSIFSYVFWGGFSSVTKTDILQLIFIIFFLIIPLLLYLLTNTKINITQSYSHQFAKMPLNYIILFSIPILFIPLSQDINIRIKSAKNIKEGKLGLIIGGFLYLFIVVTASFIGISLAKQGITLKDTETAYSLFFKNSFSGYGYIGIIAALAAIASSLDSYTLNAITSFSNDILKRFPFLEKTTSKELIKISAFVIYFVSMLIALFFNEILTLVLTALLIYISVLFPIVFAKKIKIKDNYIFISSILTICLIIIVELFKINIPYKVIIYTLFGFSSILLFYLFQKVTSR